jgi:hypothetical protein
MSRLRNALKLLALTTALVFIAALPESLRITRNLAGLLF